MLQAIDALRWTLPRTDLDPWAPKPVTVFTRFCRWEKAELQEAR